HGISVVNAPGLIDAGYRGEVRVVLLNTDRGETFVVEPGMRIAQLVVLSIPQLELVEAEELPESERGVRGFGSSRARRRDGRRRHTAPRPVPAEPRIRVSALLRWNDRVLPRP